MLYKCKFANDTQLINRHLMCYVALLFLKKLFNINKHDKYE